MNLPLKAMIFSQTLLLLDPKRPSFIGRSKKLQNGLLNNATKCAQHQKLIFRKYVKGCAERSGQV
jgi:hypothetical protein